MDFERTAVVTLCGFVITGFAFLVWNDRQAFKSLLSIFHPLALALFVLGQGVNLAYSLGAMAQERADNAIVRQLLEKANTESREVVKEAVSTDDFSPGQIAKLRGLSGLGFISSPNFATVPSPIPGWVFFCLVGTWLVVMILAFVETFLSRPAEEKSAAKYEGDKSGEDV